MQIKLIMGHHCNSYFRIGESEEATISPTASGDAVSQAFWKTLLSSLMKLNIRWPHPEVPPLGTYIVYERVTTKPIIVYN